MASSAESGASSSGTNGNGHTQAGAANEGISFWEVGAYKKCLDRVEYGYKMSNLIIEMMEDRAKIEAQYAKSLKHFSEKWQKVIDGGIVYGAHKQAWLAFSMEADSTAALHNTLAETLTSREPSSTVSTIKSWQKQAYHRSTLTGALKESKDLEGMFQKAQRVYAKRHAKVEDCRRAYHKSAAAFRVAEQRMGQSKVDGSTEAAVRSKQERLGRSELEAIQAREAYHAALRDVDIIKGEYVDKMTQAFQVSQEFERSRLDFVCELLSKLSVTLDRRSWANAIATIGDNLKERVTVAKSNVTGDLRRFSELYGADSPCVWQEFDEYDPAATMRRSSTVPSLTASRVSSVPVSSVQTPSAAVGPALTSQKSMEPASSNPPFASSATNYGSSFESANATDLTYYENADSTGSGETLKPARAKFDYNANGTDELTLRAGDVLEVYENSSVDGWSRGRKDGVDGFFPTSYAEQLPPS